MRFDQIQHANYDATNNLHKKTKMIAHLHFKQKQYVNPDKYFFLFVGCDRSIF